MAENSTANRQASSAPDAGRIYSVGCLPIILVWFLLDLIGKAIIWGVAALFGKEIPALSNVVQGMVLGFLAPLGIICIAIIGFWLYLIVSDFLSNIFGKDKRDKENDNE